MGTMSTNGAPRVVISGIGVVSPYGVGRERFWTYVSRGCSATRAITEFDAFGSKNSAIVLGAV
jgi:3-oxoacyl-(acyl-carrier-protein) synthase